MTAESRLVLLLAAIGVSLVSAGVGHWFATEVLDYRTARLLPFVSICFGGGALLAAYVVARVLKLRR